jgi:hypothetical protein
MRRFQHIVIAACLIMCLGTNTSMAGTWCGSDSASDPWNRFINKTQKETSADWWPSVDLFADLSFLATGGLSLLPWAKIACVPYGQAYLGEGCFVHDHCYDGLAYPGASRAQCDQILQERWLDACSTQYPEHERWEVWLEPRDWCREYCKETVKAMAFAVSTFGQAAWDEAAPKRAANGLVSRREIILQCIEQTPPGGTCVLPAGDYPVTLTIDRPVQLENAGGLVRIGVIE